MRLGNPWDVTHRSRNTWWMRLALIFLLALAAPTFGEGRDGNVTVGDWVILKSLGTNLKIGRQVIETKRKSPCFVVEKIQGDWLWVVGNEFRELATYKGWVKNADVVSEFQAQTYFTGLIQRDGRSAQAYYLRGCYFAHRSLRDLALDDYAGAIRLDPRFVVAYIARGEILLEAHILDDAIANFTEAIRLDPRSASARLSRAIAWEGKKNYDRAIADITEAIRLVTNEEISIAMYAARAVVWSKAKNSNRAIADFNEAIRLSKKLHRELPELLALLYVLRAQEHAAVKNLDRAIGDCSEAVRLLSSIDEGHEFLLLAYLTRGHYWGRKNDRDRAVADLTDAIRLATDDDVPTRFTFAAYYLRSAAFWIGNQDDRAIADCEKAIDLDPSSGYPYLVRGLIRREQGRYGAALADFTKCVDLDPKEECGHASCAWLWATCPEPKFRDGKKAVEAATRACELTKWRHPVHISQLAAAEAEAGDFASAIKWQSRALELHTDFESKVECRRRLDLYRAITPYRDAPDGRDAFRKSLDLPDLNVAAQ